MNLATDMHFNSARGAFGDAMVDTSLSGSSCPIQHPDNNSCLQYTGDCSGCLADATAQPGELACWCLIRTPSFSGVFGSN